MREQRAASGKKVTGEVPSPVQRQDRRVRSLSIGETAAGDDEPASVPSLRGQGHGAVPLRVELDASTAKAMFEM